LTRNAPAGCRRGGREREVLRPAGSNCRLPVAAGRAYTQAGSRGNSDFIG
jgi:hypothetical protein